ncbi:MAG: class I SAM-dependent methyltransferase [Chlamydiales bacterium]
MIFGSHLTLAHKYWNMCGKEGGTFVDATCGNGRDSLYIAKTLLTPDNGRLFCIDIQSEAIYATQNLLCESVPPKILQRISYHHTCHTKLEFLPPAIDIFVYNLGYLPGGNKLLTTNSDTTLFSLKKAMNYLSPTGIISIMSYPGHDAGKAELDSLLSFVSSLSCKYIVGRHQWTNRFRSPELFLIKQKTY